MPHSEVPSALWAWVAPWYRFDAGWYIDVAVHGYHWGRLGSANTNFMPLYPILIRLASFIPGVSVWLAALLVSDLAGLAATLALWRWGRARWPDAQTMRFLLLVVCFPFAFFLAAPYAESLFLALAVLTFLSAETGRWSAATGLAALATITRPVGLAVVLGLIALALARKQRLAAALACAALLPLVLFSLYLGLEFGRPLGFLTYHSAGWVSPHGGILQTVESQFHTGLSPLDRVDAFLAALFLLSGILAFRTLGPGYGTYTLVGVLLPLVHGLVSMERYVVVMFPAMAVWTGWKNRAAQLAILFLSAVILCPATMMYAAGYSVF